MYRYEKDTGDIVIEGWGKGIAPSPHLGIGNMQVANISTLPEEIMVNYGRAQQSQTPVIGGSMAQASGTTLTYNGTIPLKVGTAIDVTAGGGTGLSGDYWIKSISGSTITLSGSLGSSTISGITAGTLTFNTLNMGRPLAWTYTSSGYAVVSGSWQTVFPNYAYFVLDNNNFVWTFSFGATSQTWQLIDDGIKSGTTGIACYGNYLLIAADKLYFKPLSNPSGTNVWTAFTANFALSGNTYRHYMLLGHDNVLYITDNNTICSLTVVAGFQPSHFDPTSSSTFTAADSSAPALTLPYTEIISTLAELGTNLGIGCWSNNLYFWNRTPVPLSGANGSMLNSFFYPVILPEDNVAQMITVNNLLYIFCGQKGNVYITNGTTVSAVLTVPDYTTGQVEPYYQWGGASYLRGRLFFSVMDSNSKTGGIWSFVPQQSYYIEQDMGSSLRIEAQNTYGTYAGMATLIFSPLEFGSTYNGTQANGQLARGPQYWAAWDDGTSGASANPYGVDYSSTTPGLTKSNGTATTQGQTVIETDLIPFGQLLGSQKGTVTNVEFKLAAPLVANESVVINFRGNLTDNFSTVGTVQYEGTSTGSIVGYISPNQIQNVYWLQFQIVLTSTTSNPSFVRFKELRIRTNR